MTPLLRSGKAPVTETRYEVSHPTGILYTPSLTVALACKKAKGKVTITEITETRRVLPAPLRGRKS